MDVDTQDKESPKTPKPHDFLWFPDGNVILATDIYLFKVHKSLLSLHSSVFRDMFELPNVGGATAAQCVAGMTPELYDGLPLVTLVGDKGEDVAHLLRAVFDRHSYRRDDDNTPLDTVTALLLLSTKYDFKGIRDDVIIQISKHYPMTLPEYDFATYEELPLFGRYPLGCHLSLLMAAYTANVDVLLPILYVNCSDYALDGIFDDDGGLGSPDCLRTLIQGRDILELNLNKLMADLPDDLWEVDGNPNCAEDEPCLGKARYTRLSALISQAFNNTQGSKVVENHLSPVCSGCRSFVKKEIDNKREKIWAEVPSYFGFPGWDVLQSKLKEMSEPRSESLVVD